jgi:hypothetical protein
MAFVYALQDSPLMFGVSEGLMGTLLILGVASWIGYKSKKWKAALVIGVLLAGLVSFVFGNVQATLIVDDDEIAVKNLYRGGYRLRKDNVVSMAQFRSRGGGTVLRLAARDGREYGIVAGGGRREQLEEVLAKELRLTAEPPSHGLKRWSRRS